ncbi:MAG TPA: MaoC family dehydratase [Candidatus Acidoferrales bacterium]|nr:MaoC family dehydratase [Candidatus Acidoferrales bacterium]
MAALIIDTPGALADFVGQEVAVTDWLTITQDRISRFAEATEDRQWIHVDPERARKESPYGTTIAHGFLTLSLISRFMKEAIQIKGGVKMGINYGLNRVRFPSPVRVDSEIRARVSIHAAKELPSVIQVAYSIVVECRETSKPCCVAEWIVRYYVD